MSLWTTIRDRFIVERAPVGPPTAPRVYGTMPELAAVTLERNELRIALAAGERAHEEAANKCQELTRDLELCRVGNRSLANEVRVLNELLSRSRKRYRRSRRELAAALDELQVAVTELEKRGGRQ